MCTKTFLINNNKQAAAHVTFKGHFHDFFCVFELIELRDLGECDSEEKNRVVLSRLIKMKVMMCSQEYTTSNIPVSIVIYAAHCVMKYVSFWIQKTYLSLYLSFSQQVSALAPVAEPLI